MKFPRNAKLLRNQLDVTPFAAVFFLLVIFLLLGALVPTPGLPLRLPAAGDLPGTDQPTVTVAVDASNRLYYANQIIDEADLRLRLREAAAKSAEPLTLVVLMDESLPYGDLVRLHQLASAAGIQSVVLATLPRIVPGPGTGAAASP